MNRVYKVIFNRSRQLVQVVPEYARNKGKQCQNPGKEESEAWPKSCSLYWLL